MKSHKYNEISTLQYMGSKARIISHICDPIIKNKPIKTVVDLFAGTGLLAMLLKHIKISSAMISNTMHTLLIKPY